MLTVAKLEKFEANLCYVIKEKFQRFSFRQKLYIFSAIFIFYCILIIKFLKQIVEMSHDFGKSGHTYLQQKKQTSRVYKSQQVVEVKGGGRRVISLLRFTWSHIFLQESKHLHFRGFALRPFYKISFQAILHTNDSDTYILYKLCHVLTVLHTTILRVLKSKHFKVYEVYHIAM